MSGGPTRKKIQVYPVFRTTAVDVDSKRGGRLKVKNTTGAGSQEPRITLGEKIKIPWSKRESQSVPLGQFRKGQTKVKD